MAYIVYSALFTCTINGLHSIFVDLGKNEKIWDIKKEYTLFCVSVGCWRENTDCFK